VSAPVIDDVCSVQNNVMSAPLKGHTGTIRVVRAQSGSSSGSGDSAVEGSDFVASGGAGDNRVRIWDLQSGIHVFAASLSVLHVMFVRGSVNDPRTTSGCCPWTGMAQP
jgi:WD40 repeat protein